MSSSPRRAAGFTLLEVLAGVAILAIAYSQLGSSGIQGLQHEGEARRRIAASLIADTLMTDLESAIEAGATPPVGETEGEQDGFRTLVRIEPFTLEVPEEEGPGGKRIGRARSRLGGDGGATPQEAQGPSLLGGGGPGAPSPLRRIEVRVAWDEGVGERSTARVTYALDAEGAAGILDALSQAAAQSAANQPDANPGEQPLEAGRP
jgi:prepilin-type N-terminal cleavage/methylation domain-containing protein